MNTVEVLYSLSPYCEALQVGRLVAQKSLSLGCLERDVRNALAAKHYWDVDFVNAHPTILLHMAKQRGWSHVTLEHYVEHREKCLEEVQQSGGINREDAKAVFISVLYGSKAHRNTPFLAALTQELQVMTLEIISQHPQVYALAKRKVAQEADKPWKTPEATCVALVLQTEERKCLLALEAALFSRGRSLDVYIHDGGLVRKADGEEAFPEEILRACESDIERTTGYALKLALKPLTTGYKIDEDIETRRHPHVPNADYEKMKSDFEKAHFYLEESNLVCRENDDGTLSEFKVNDAKTALTNIWRFTYLNNNTQNIVPFLDLWLTDPQRRTLRKKVFRPGAEADGTFYNLFRGFAAPYQPDVQDTQPGLDRFLLLLHSLCEENEEQNVYVQKWLAHMIQKPQERPGVCLIFTGKQGCGKDMMWDFIGEKVLGRSLFYRTAQADRDIYGNHSMALNGTLLVKLEESSGYVNRKEANKLKSLITQTATIINPKGLPSYEIDVFARMVMTTNDIVPVKVEDSDRRYNIMLASERYRGNHAFWEETAKLLAMPETAVAVRSYLEEVDLEGFSVRSFPKTVYTTELKEAETCPEEEFLIDYAHKHDEETASVRPPEFHKAYVNWVMERGGMPLSLSTFGKQMVPHIARGIIRKKMIRGRPVYEINVAALRRANPREDEEAE